MTDTVPFVISNNPKSLELWNGATQEIKTAGLLISEFRTSSAVTNIEANYDFAEKWHKTFPSYKYGDKIVKFGAKIAGESPTSIYSVLQTTSFYDRNRYKTLDQAARANGVVIYWTHLRTITSRLSDRPDVCAAVEAMLVKEQMTDALLKKAINNLLAESAVVEEPSVTQRLDEAVEICSAFLKNKPQIVEVLGGVDPKSIDGIEQGQEVLSKLSDLSRCIEDIHEFLTEQAESIQKLYDVILKANDPAVELEENDGDIFHEVGTL